MCTQTKHVRRYSVFDVPVHALLAPIFVPLRTFGWWNEILHFHLFKFTCAKNKVSRSYFIAKRLTNLSNAKWWLTSRCLQDVCKVDKHSLSGLWTHKHVSAFALNRASMRLEHEVESPGFSESTALHLLWAVSVVKLVFTKTLFTHCAIDKRIAEVGQVSARFKHCMGAQNRCVNEHHVITLLNHCAHPCVFNVSEH